MALVFVLWVMTILCAVALELGFSSHLRLQVTASTGGASKTFFLARAGVEKAVADLVESRDRVQSQADLREDDTRPYQNVELGEGSYTLCAGADDEGELVYGIADEAAKINVNTAEASVLTLVPGMDADLAAEIAALRAQDGLHDLKDLILSEKIDLLTLHGEDQNDNGILDPNEDDGDQSWPPDNADGWLDGGLAVYLTTWSAARNVTAEGSERINLNSASAKEIVKSVTGVTDQEAESIVAHREKNKFASIVDLLDVELVAKVTEQPKGKPDQQAGTPRKPDGKASEQAKTSKKPEGSSEDSGKPSGQPNKSKKAESSDKKKKPQTTVRGTGQKAFDMKKFRQIADQVTTQDEEVIKGVVNINTAPAEVLACLPGFDDALARRVAGWRQGHTAGFETAADLLDVEGVSMDVFKQVCPLVSARSDVFSVRSFGVLGTGDMYCCVSAVIDRTGDTAKIGYWRELE